MSKSTWNIDTSHSSIAFQIRHMMFAKVRGQFTRWQGQIELDPDDLSASTIEVRIDAASIDTATAKRDEHLRSADFLDVEEHPHLFFRSTRIEKSGDRDRYLVHGELTIRGVAREVLLETDFGGLGTDPWGQQRAGFSATTSISRSDFGLEWNQVLEAGGVLVGDKLEISLEVQAVQAAASEAA